MIVHDDICNELVALHVEAFHRCDDQVALVRIEFRLAKREAPGDEIGDFRPGASVGVSSGSTGPLQRVRSGGSASQGARAIIGKQGRLPYCLYRPAAARAIS